jgi:ABC-2 type transport system permease protein
VSALAEVVKLPAFVRRDVRITLSYRMAALGGLLGLAAHAIVLSFIGQLVDPSRLPTFGGSRVTYMEFVTIGIALNMVVMSLLHQVATVIRTEQMLGTLESLLSTPTKIGTIQVGSATLALLTVPFRLGLFIVVLAMVFGLHFFASGIAPAAAIMAAFLPFLWGLGLLSAGAILTFRRGVGALAVGTTMLGLASGAFFPLSLLPHWLQTVANANPLAIAIHGLRETLIGGTGWTSTGADLLELIPLSVVAMAAGVIAFRLALARERRNGTLGLY